MTAQARHARSRNRRTRTPRRPITEKRCDLVPASPPFHLFKVERRARRSARTPAAETGGATGVPSCYDGVYENPPVSPVSAVAGRGHGHSVRCLGNSLSNARAGALRRRPDGHVPLRRRLLRRIHAGGPAGKRRPIDAASRHQRSAGGRIHLERVGARRRPLRIRLDGPDSRAAGARAHPRYHGNPHLLDSTMDVPGAPRNSGYASGRPEGHLRAPPEHGHHQPGFSALLRAGDSQDRRTLPRQSRRDRLSDRQ